MLSVALKQILLSEAKVSLLVNAVFSPNLFGLDVFQSNNNVLYYSIRTSLSQSITVAGAAMSIDQLGVVHELYLY